MTQVAIIDLIADIAQIARNAPNPTIIRAYNRAAREFCRQSRWLRSTLPGVTEAETRLYSLGTDPDLEVIGIKAMSCANQSGNPQPRSLRVSVPTGWIPGQRSGQPRRYAYVPEAQFALDPLPDAVYDLVVTIVLMPTLATNSIPAELLPRWDQTLQAGALAYLYEVPDQPWTNLPMAQVKLRAFQSGIGAARADEQRDYNVGTFIARKPPFIVGGM
jgi:hypothetical protein